MSYQSVGSIEPDPMIERILLLKQEAYVYKIPAAQVPADDNEFGRVSDVGSRRVALEEAGSSRHSKRS